MKRLRHILAISLLMAALGLLSAPKLYAQKIALKIDAAKAMMWMPNMGLEFAVGERYSFDISAFGTYKVWGKDWTIVCIQPEFRWWLSGRQMARAYVGVAAIGAHYDIDFSGFGHKGDCVGGGLTMGYTWLLSARWSVEAYAGFGAVAYKENRFKNKDICEEFNPNKKDFGNASGYLLVPTKIGVSFSYILK